MALSIRTTGVEDYVDGSANIRMLVVGPVGSGKTRMSSWWPKPIYADCESGRASLADRQMPYAEVKNSTDMLDFLSYLKGLEGKPKADRQYQTVVVDTLDGFQRKVIDERLQQTKRQTFTGFEDWGYLDSKMQMLMTRLLNLDYNVIVACHPKDKMVKDGEGEFRESMLHLKGDIKDSCLFDFDLVGFLGTFFVAEDGERVEKRGLTFKKTPDRPFLKDRLNAMPNWVPITLTGEQDYEFIRDALMTKLDGLTAGEVVGEIPSVAPEGPGSNVAQSAGGPLPPQDPREVPLHQFDKTTLVKMCRDEGVTTCPDGSPIKGNTIKAELIQALEHHRALNAVFDTAAAGVVEPAAESDATSASPEPAPSADAADVSPDPTEGTALEPESESAVQEYVDTTTGEITTAEPAPDTPALPIEEVPSVPDAADNIPVTPAGQATTSAPTSGVGTCEKDGCNVDLSTQNASYVQLSQIRFKKRLCGEHYVEQRQAVNA